VVTGGKASSLPVTTIISPGTNQDKTSTNAASLLPSTDAPNGIETLSTSETAAPAHSPPFRDVAVAPWDNNQQQPIDSEPAPNKVHYLQNQSKDRNTSATPASEASTQHQTSQEQDPIEGSKVILSTKHRHST